MIEEWSNLLYTLFIRDTFGSPILFGLFIVLSFVFIGFKLKLSFDAMAVGVVSLVVFMAGFSVFTSFPTWIVPISVMVIGLLIAFAVLKIGKR